MLKNYGNFFANNEDNMNEIASMLENAGYQIAYISNNSGSIVKEVVEEDPE